MDATPPPLLPLHANAQGQLLELESYLSLRTSCFTLLSSLIWMHHHPLSVFHPSSYTLIKRKADSSHMEQMSARFHPWNLLMSIQSSPVPRTYIIPPQAVGMPARRAHFLAIPLTRHREPAVPCPMYSPVTLSQ